MAGPTSIVYMPVAGERVFYRLAESATSRTALSLIGYSYGCAVGRMEPEAEDETHFWVLG